MIRREVDSLLGDIDRPHAAYEFKGGNPDIDKTIDRIGLEALQNLRGYLPLTCHLIPACKKYHYKKAKAI